jgi:hypothetical protein
MLKTSLKVYSVAAIFCSVFLSVVICVPLVQASFKPIPNTKVDQAQKNKAQQIVAKLFSKWNEGKFDPLPDDFTAAMKKAMTSEAQKATYSQLKNTYGKFQSIDFVAASSSEKPSKLVMYRFKGVFSEKKSAPEIRILMDKKGKVSGLWFSAPKKKESQ